MKRLLSLVLALLMLCCVSITAFATENNTSETEDDPRNYNVTTVCPWEQISTYGVNPPTEGWDIRTDGAYTFSGKASYSKLYLSKLIYGSTYYAVTVTNRSYSNVLTVNPHDVYPTASIDIDPREDMYQRFMLKEGKTYFSLSFEAPSDFEGIVTEWIYQ
jgi:hypothetical protein